MAHTAETIRVVAASGPFQPDWESLKAYNGCIAIYWTTHVRLLKNL